jgi:hypothetical protein
MSIAKPPLTVLYRGDINKVLRITAEKRLPPDGDRSTDHSLYGSVLFADLKNLIESSPKLDHYYFPEEGAGTRARFDAENGSTPLKWPKMERSRDHLTEQVPDYIEELDGDFSFIELVSYPQLSRNTKEPASCDQLKKMGIRAAVVCANSNTCDHFIPADYELVIKVLPSSGEGSNGFVITNRAECMIAEALSPKVNKCQFSGTLHNNIVAIDATKNAASNFPEYLSCVP